MFPPVPADLLPDLWLCVLLFQPAMQLLAVLLLGLFTFGMGMANVTGIVMSMVIGVLLIVSMVLPRLLKSKGADA